MNSDENSDNISKEAEVWKKYKANKEKQENDQSKGEFWKNYGKQKDSGSNSESSEDKDNVDSPELGDTDRNGASSKDKSGSRSSDSKDSDENEVLNILLFEKKRKTFVSPLKCFHLVVLRRCLYTLCFQTFS